MLQSKLTSRNNDIVRRAKALHARKGRLEQGLQLLEGEKIVREAIHSGIPLADVFVLEGKESFLEELAHTDARVSIVSSSVMEAIADVKTPQWVCATAPFQEAPLPHSAPVGLIAALDCVQDPGNLGTIIRTADAMGAVGVLLGDGCADPYSPKVIRSAMGSTFHIPIWRGNLPNALKTLRDDGFICICGDLQGDTVLPQPKDRCVIVIGNEGHGVSDETAALCHRYCLPMYGQAESLNASIAAALLLYEVARTMHTSV